jgi:hypothetical protein
MFFGRGYLFKGEARLTGGRLVRFQVPIKARLMTGEEIIREVRCQLEREVRFKTGEGVAYLSYIYDALSLCGGVYGGTQRSEPEFLRSQDKAIYE